MVIELHLHHALSLHPESPTVCPPSPFPRPAPASGFLTRAPCLQLGHAPKCSEPDPWLSSVATADYTSAGVLPTYTPPSPAQPQ